MFYVYGRSFWVPFVQKIYGKRTVAEVVEDYGQSARQRMAPFFHSAGVSYPPENIVLLGIKDTAQLELWVDVEGKPYFIRSYPVQALSGVAGPKLREGDQQVPEGIYRIDGMNPNSAFHLSLKLNYPNTFDMKHAVLEGRDQNPGSNIFIHGKAVSVGCLAMGDEVIEELFVLVSDAGRHNIKVVIAPRDPRKDPLDTDMEPSWIGELYTSLNAEFARFVGETEK